MPSPPSTASSTSSSSSLGVPPAQTGSRRDPPLNPPKPLFFIDRKPSSSDVAEESRPDPFRTPDGSAPTTPRSGSIISNPFSPPASVVNLHSDHHVTIAEPSHARGSSSHVSVHSSLRNSSTDLNIREVRSRLSSRVNSQIRDSFMSPPMLAKRATVSDMGAASRISISGPRSKRNKSTMLTGPISKPWIGEKDIYGRLAYWTTYGVALIGLVGSVLLCYFGWKNVPRVGNLCLIMEDNFEKFDTDYTWSHEVDMSGFGNGEFEMTTNSPNNSFVKDGHLYILPTLTSDIIGSDAIFNGHTFNITGCTNTNLTACGAVSNFTTGTVIPPVMSARVTTRRSHHVQFGKVEVRARLPRGDWLWPSIFMMPVENAYGAWPLSGEIDLLQARGNGPEYKAQGIDYVRGALQWGPFAWLNGVSKTYGFWTDRRKTYNTGFHTFAMEWTPKFIRIYVDSRLHKLVDLRFNQPFFERGDFPQTVANGSQWIVTPNPWKDGTMAAPFDKAFYLAMHVAVGGTNGWFPDGVGDKPWLDGSLSQGVLIQPPLSLSFPPAAMRDFAKQQDTWSKTWAQNIEERAMVIDSVKMWQSC
ncbi:concanavalin A-like lectin/glucanase domain-containing protein [Cristinia sonorae]|uniref:Concanavalin A-like lectin/glucanase domain-containing protein n=1 Tax=Cristinia sonorae TaxID=1940300 RepID=A0A8K0UV87_9AGAR|nr:concanavalin A-like lectin/glucanase domain-containing protein [Cristinia sonorae]